MRRLPPPAWAQRWPRREGSGGQGEFGRRSSPPASGWRDRAECGCGRGYTCAGSCDRVPRIS
eukprot:scaffold61414_cov25-Tisochrysis_lutea.AAC.3